jgi:hypothetical protein
MQLNSKRKQRDVLGSQSGVPSDFSSHQARSTPEGLAQRRGVGAVASRAARAPAHEPAMAKQRLGEPYLPSVPRARSGGVSHENATYLKKFNVKEQFRFGTLSEALMWTGDLPEDLYSFSGYCVFLADLLASATATGWDDPDMSTDVARRRIVHLLDSLRRRKSCRLAEFNAYKLSGNYAMWTLTNTVFLIECYLLLFLLEVNPQAFERTAADVHVYLREEALLLFRPPGTSSSSSSGISISSYTQMQLHDTLFLLSSRWNTLHCVQERMGPALNHLQLRAAQLVCCAHTETVMDGEDGEHRIKVAGQRMDQTRRSQVRFRLSSEMFSQMATWFSYFQRSLEAMRSFKRPTDAPLPGHAEEFLGKQVPPQDIDWLFYDSTESSSETMWRKKKRSREGAKPLEEEVLPNLRAWLASQMGASLEGKAAELVKRTLGQLRLRPGEAERYARGNNGIFASDPASAMDYSRTPHQTASWGTALDGQGLKRILQGEGNYAGLMQGALVCRIFDSYWQRKTSGRFEWGTQNVLLERDFFSKEHQQSLQEREHPVILQCMGEYNVWFRGELLRTRTAERAVLLWSVLVAERLRCRVNVGTDSWDVAQLRTLLQEWGPTGHGLRMQQLKRRYDRRQAKLLRRLGRRGERETPLHRHRNGSEEEEEEDLFGTTASASVSSGEEDTASSSQGEENHPGHSGAGGEDDPMEDVRYLMEEDPLDTVFNTTAAQVDQAFFGIDSFH